MVGGGRVGVCRCGGRDESLAGLKDEGEGATEPRHRRRLATYARTTVLK